MMLILKIINSNAQYSTCECYSDSISFITQSPLLKLISKTATKFPESLFYNILD